jgi:hypothetical protein
MNRITLTLCVVFPLAVVSCEKGETKPDVTPAASAPLTDEAVDQAAIPVKEDFEEEAYAAINEDNLEEQIDSLEKEIQDDQP